MRIIRRLVAALFIGLATLAVFGVLGTVIPHPLVFSAAGAPAPTRHVLLIANAIHTDIALPIDAETMAALGFLADTGLPVFHPQARYLLLGWGGRSFYLETPTLADIKPGPTFRALTLDSSVMHVDVLGQIDTSDPTVIDMAVGEAAYQNLLADISASFTRRDGVIVPIDGFAFGSSDRFFEAEGGFNALLGCNVWTSRMLRSAGTRTGLWNPIPASLVASLRLFNTIPALRVGDDGSAETP